MAVQAQLFSENLGFSVCGSQDLIDFNGGFFDFSLPLQPQQQQIIHLQNHQGNQNLSFGNGEVISQRNNNLLSMAFYHSLAAQFENQKQDIDRILLSQNQRLRSALQEQRKQQLLMILKRVESKTLSLFRQKDEEMSKARKKTMELEDCLRRTEMENQTWQRIAKEKEDLVINLNNTLEQIKEKVYYYSSVPEDAESCCDFSQNRVNRDETEETKKMSCRRCNSRSSCVLFLPCRHLCSCKSCEAFLDSCPVCKSVKKSSIEVFLF